MSLWKNTDANTSVPKFAPSTVNLSNTQDNSNLIFSNITADDVIEGEKVGVFGVDVEEQGYSPNPRGGHAGWVLVKQGSGPVTSIEITDGGTGYNATGFITFTSDDGTDANASYTSNEGVIETVTLNSGGSGYYVVPDALGDPGGSNAAFSITLGGRAGRRQVETLVAMGSMTGDAESTVFSD